MAVVPFSETVFVKSRWIIVIFFILPASIICKVYDFIYNTIKLHSKKKFVSHSNKLKQIQDEIKQWHDAGQKQMLCTSRPGWQTISFRKPTYKKSLWQINLMHLVDILDIDTANQVVTVEPMVKMKQLSQTLNPLGWTIPVIPELDDLTVSGLIMGIGLESSSHRYGLFQDNCISYEIILSSGEIVTCSKDENPDLYYAIPSSYGTLGFITAVKIKMIPAKKYVAVDYFPVYSIDELYKTLQKTMKEYEFVDAIAYSLNTAVVVAGNMTDELDADKSNYIGYFWKPLFYRHVEAMLKSKQRVTEYMPLQHYYHRYSKGLFWEIKDIIPFGNNPIFRYLLGWCMPPKISFLKRVQGPGVTKFYDKYHFIQDYLVPISSLKATLELSHHELKIYPVWVCPFVLKETPSMVHRKHSDDIYLDIGVYGTTLLPTYNAVETTRKMEKFVRDQQGFQMLYADCYMTEPEFREMFDHSLYDKMRTKLNCKHAFPEVYNKVNRKVRV